MWEVLCHKELLYSLFTYSVTSPMQPTCVLLCIVYVYIYITLCISFTCFFSLCVCQEPLESIITPAGFAPATHAPSSVPSSLPSSSQSSYYSPSSLSSQSSHPHSSHSEPLSQDSGSSYPTGVASGVKKEGGNKVVTKQNKGATPSKQGGTSSNDDSAASVSPHDGVPQHPDLIDPGSSFTNTGQPCLTMYIHTHILYL